MKYKITVEKVGEIPEGKYHPETEKIYEQTVEYLEIQKVIEAVNPKEVKANPLAGHNDKKREDFYGNCTCDQLAPGRACPVHTLLKDWP